ncbi:glutamate-5-semialdehyde dehydrogenase [Sinobaca qinghaiensis]|uniref:Gamma-glutamyl phosphate reductase n=1 Tax=Sinobaca qinghaiensis TaxID=342944 RepID=A0A419V659_9BACL|nr:glutamate-5-semialdehyde dehydrogenase [Sinobaca qinghaiensis]RKD75473.1 glutamate-5-semialdehyde dehydrogenase [Sinobaca qinghaiensis]
MSKMIEQGLKVKQAAGDLAVLNAAQKNNILNELALSLEEHTLTILEANQKDIEAGMEKGFTEALLDRLRLSEERIKTMADGFRDVAALPDPIGEEIEAWDRPNGLEIKKIRVPLGAVGIIYEARPNVTADATALAVKTGNAALLRGSSSAYHSNQAIIDAIHAGMAKYSLAPDSIQLAEDTSREGASEMFKMNKYLDVLIPRGGAGLIQTVVDQSSIPVLETGVGNCHVLIDETAERKMAIDIAINAKTQRPSVCNACETILVHEKWLQENGSELIEELFLAGVEIRGDERIQALHPDIKAAVESDWGEEYLDYIVSMKCIDNVEEGISHIKMYGTSHSESIVTENEDNKLAFFAGIDAAALYHNASTRFTDGFEFGFGAEIGISTQKLHARGPMGLKALTSYKYIIQGTGQVKE